MSDACANPDCGHSLSAHGYSGKSACRFGKYIAGHTCSCRAFVADGGQPAPLELDAPLYDYVERGPNSYRNDPAFVADGDRPDDFCWCGSSPPCLEHNGPADQAVTDVLVEVAAKALRDKGIHYNSILHADFIARAVLEAVEPLIVKRERKAWAEGHRHRWQRGPDECRCGAWSSGECGCGKYGSGELVSLADNPHQGQV